MSIARNTNGAKAGRLWRAELPGFSPQNSIGGSPQAAAPKVSQRRRLLPSAPWHNASMHSANSNVPEAWVIGALFLGSIKSDHLNGKRVLQLSKKPPTAWVSLGAASTTGNAT